MNEFLDTVLFGALVAGAFGLSLSTLWLLAMSINDPPKNGGEVVKRSRVRRRLVVVLIGSYLAVMTQWLTMILA